MMCTIKALGSPSAKSQAKLPRQFCRQRLVFSHQLRDFAEAGSKEVLESKNLFVRGFGQFREPHGAVMPAVCVGHELNAADFQIYTNLHDLPLQELVCRYQANRLEHVRACISEVLVVQRIRHPAYGCVRGLQELKIRYRAEREDRGDPPPCLISAHLPRDVDRCETDSDGNRNLRPGRPFARLETWPLEKNGAVATCLIHGGSSVVETPILGVVRVGVNS